LAAYFGRSFTERIADPLDLRGNPGKEHDVEPALAMLARWAR